MTYHALLMTLTYDLLDLRRKPLIINDLTYDLLDLRRKPLIINDSR